MAALRGGLTVNAENRKILTNDGSPCTLYLDNSKMKKSRSSNTTALYIVQQNKLSCTAEIHSRIDKAAMAFGSLTWCLFRRHSVSLTMKMRVIRSIMVSILLYGAGMDTLDS